jgi:branched-chain amino acid transport system permease protein
MRLTWIIAGGLTAVGGVMLALTQLVFWNMGFQLLLLMFAAVIVGGVGSPFGTMVGGFLIGIVSQVSVALPYVRDHADLKVVVAMAVMFIVLIVRPNGILGRGARLS